MPILVYSGCYTSSLIKKRDRFGVWSSLAALPRNQNFSLGGTAETDLWSASEGPNRVCIYHWNGLVWAEQTLPDNWPDSGLHEHQANVGVWDENTIYGWAGSPTYGGFRLWRTTNGGGLWTTLDTGSLGLDGGRPNAGLVVGPDEIYLGANSYSAGTGNAGVWRWTASGGMQVESIASGLPDYNPSPFYRFSYIGLGWTGEDPDDLWVHDQGANSAGYGIRLYRGKFGSWSLQHRFDPNGGYSDTYYTIQDGQNMMTMDADGFMVINCIRQSDGAHGYLFGDPTAGQLAFTAYGGGSNIGQQSSGGGYYFVAKGNGLLFDRLGWSEAPPTTPFNGNLGGSLVLVTDPDPPEITPIDPVDGETEVEKDHLIKFTVTDADTGVDLSTVILNVDGVVVYSDQRVQVDGWGVSMEAITDGYAFIARPTKRETYYTSNEDVQVTVHASDLNGNPASEQWTFSTIRNLWIRIYPMILGGVRTNDEDAN